VAVARAREEYRCQPNSHLKVIIHSRAEHWLIVSISSDSRSLLGVPCPAHYPVAPVTTTQCHSYIHTVVAIPHALLPLQ
jgi:hypothetical protein